MESILKRIKKEQYWVFSFLIASITMIVFFLLQGMLGGDYIVLRSDMLSGNIAGFKEFARNILNGNNPFFSFSVGMGLNSVLSVTSGCLSPFNLLYVILYSVDENIVTMLIIILKVGCIASCFQLYSRAVLKNSSFSSVIFSSFYALCSFCIAYGTIHTYWLDAVYLLPLLCIAIVRCIDENKRVLLIVLYSYLFITQFYMAYMVGMFTLLYVLVHLFFMHDYKKESKVKEFIYCFTNWVMCGVIAVLLSAVFWVPSLFFIMGNRVPDSSEVIDINTNLLQIINSFYWGQGYGINGDYAYIYCGIPTLLIMPLFFADKENGAKEKIFYGILLGFLLICTIFTPFNNFMHVFDQPDNFWYRYSFIISFVACSIASKQIGKGKLYSKKIIVYLLAGFMILYLVQQQFVSLSGIDAAFLPSQNSSKGFLINLVFAAGWIVLSYLFLKYEKYKYVLSFLMVVIVMLETSTNTLCVIQQKEEKEWYYPWYHSMKTATEKILEDDGLYRVTCTNGKVSNADMWFGYNGINDFGDVEKYNVRRFLTNIGFSTSTRWVNEAGYNPVSNMLLGIKYNIVLPNETFDFEKNENVNEYNYVENKNVLNIGYMSSGNIIVYDYSGRNVFENSNEIVSALSGVNNDCFKPVSDENIKFDEFGVSYIKGESETLDQVVLNDSKGRLYITVFNQDYDEVYLQMEYDEEEIGYFLYDFYIFGAENNGCTKNIYSKFSNANKMYYNADKDKYTLFLYGEENVTPETVDFNGFNIYYLDYEALEEQFRELSKEQLVVTKWSNGYIEGKVNVIDDKRLMFTSIPFDLGWKVYVDDVEVETVRLIDGAFLGFFLPSDGEHHIVMKYECPGMKIGMYVSILGILALISVAFEKKLKRKKKSKNE